MNQPDLSPEAVAIWLKQLDRHKLHSDGWIKINKRFHGITHAIRPFLHQQFSDPKERQAAYDGLTLALSILAHFEDIRQLAELAGDTQAPEPAPKRQLPKAS